MVLFSDLYLLNLDWTVNSTLFVNFQGYEYKMNVADVAKRFSDKRVRWFDKNTVVLF